MDRSPFRRTRRPRTAKTCLFAAALLASLAAATAAPAQVACRPNRLGTETCRGPYVPPPLARPPGFEARQGLGRALAREDPDLKVPEIIPSRKRSRLGKTFTNDQDRAIGGPCRADRLGNLVCR